MPATKLVVTPKHFGNALVGMTPVVVCTFPPGISTVRSVNMANTTDMPAADIKVWVCIVPPTESAGKMNTIAWGLRIVAGGVHQDDAVHEVEAGGSCVAWCDAADGCCIIVDGATAK